MKRTKIQAKEETGNHNSHLLVDGRHYGRPYPHAQFEPYVVEGLEEEGVSQGGEEETPGVHVPDPVRGGGVPREHDQLSANRVYAIKDGARWFAAKHWERWSISTTYVCL